METSLHVDTACRRSALNCCAEMTPAGRTWPASYLAFSRTRIWTISEIFARCGPSAHSVIQSRYACMRVCNDECEQISYIHTYIHTYMQHGSLTGRCSRKTVMNSKESAESLGANIFRIPSATASRKLSVRVPHLTHMVDVEFKYLCMYVCMHDLRSQVQSPLSGTHGN